MRRERKREKKSCKGEAGRREKGGKRRRWTGRSEEERQRESKTRKRLECSKNQRGLKEKEKGGRPKTGWTVLFSGLERPWDRKTGWASLPYWPVCNSCTKNNSAISVGDWREGVMNTRKVTATAKQRTSIKKLRAGPPFFGMHLMPFVELPPQKTP